MADRPGQRPRLVNEGKRLERVQIVKGPYKGWEGTVDSRLGNPGLEQFDHRRGEVDDQYLRTGASSAAECRSMLQWRGLGWLGCYDFGLSSMESR